MNRSTMYRIAIPFVAVSFLTAGCFVAPPPLESLDIVLPGGVTQTVAARTGPELLADTAWTAIRKADENEQSDLVAAPAPGPYGGLLNGGILARPPVEGQIFVIDVAEDGRITLIRENGYLLPNIYGDTSVVDGTFLTTKIPGLTYALESFGVSVGDAMGIAIVSDVRFLNMSVGRAVIYAWGSGDGDRIDGRFGYLLDFSEGLGGLVLETGGDQYAFYLLRQP